MERRDRVREFARERGFGQCRFAAVEPLPESRTAFVERWVEEGQAAGMAWYGRNLAKRLDPARVLPGIRTVVCLAWPYRPAPAWRTDWRQELRGRIASYAAGFDYHRVVGPAVEALARHIDELWPGARSLSYLDTGPILEREWASRAGIGWFGRNTNLLHPDNGSWFFLAEVLTTAEILPDPPIADRCGTCRRCLEDCPTGALSPGYQLDARRCISYWTIEHRGPIAADMRPGMGPWVFGCDDCQEVCPWNEPDDEEEVVRRNWLQPFLPDLLGLDEEGFEASFRPTPLWRTRREGLARNAAIVLGNTGNPDAVRPLERALREDPAATVRGAAAWALGRIPTTSSADALRMARRREVDSHVLAELTAAGNGGSDG